MYDAHKIHQAVIALDWHGLRESARALDRLGKEEIEEQEWRDISAKEINDMLKCAVDDGFFMDSYNDASEYLYTVKGEIRKGKYHA